MFIYFETGRLIDEHVRLNGGRAEFGAQVVRLLAEDLKIAHHLSDVFLAQESGEDVLLSHHLLANGYAHRMDEYALTDWDGDVSKSR